MAAGGSVEGLFEKNEKERLITFSSLTNDGIKYTGSEKPVLAMLNEFRKDEKTGFCDVIIRVEGMDFPAHRCILAANSQLFYNMFNSGMRESEERLLTLQSVSCAAMASLLDYFYTREITIKEESLEEVLDAASFLLVKPVQQACIQVLSDKLGSNNCFSTKHLAHKYNAAELLDKADHFIKKNFSCISKGSDEFVGISREELCALISSDQIMVESEEDAYSSVIRWINHDIPNRKEFLSQLLSQLRCGSLAKPFIKDRLLNEPLIKNCAASRSVLETWIKIKNRKRKTKQQKLQYPTRPSTKVHDVVVTFIGQFDQRIHDCTGFDVNTQQDVDLPCLPRHQGFPSVAVINQTIYILGGSKHYDLSGVTSHVSSLSLTSGSNQSLSWEEKASFSEKRSEFAVAVLGSYIYVLGGLSPSNHAPVDVVERYDSNTDIWETVSPLCVPRGSLGAVGMQNFVLAIGGCIGNTRVSSNIVEKYYPAQNSWVQVAPLNVDRVSLYAVCFSNKVYVMGQTSGNSPHQNSCEVYNARSNEWILIADFLYPYQHLCLVGTFPVNGTLHACFADIAEDKMKDLRLNTKSCMPEKSKPTVDIMSSTSRRSYKAFVVQVPKFHLELLPAVDETMGDDDSYSDEDFSDYYDYDDDYDFDDDYEDEFNDDDEYDDDFADWGADWVDPHWLL